MYLKNYEFDARRIERRFQREIRKNNNFHTIKGCLNTVTKYGTTFLSIRTKSSNKPFTIMRKSIRRALAFVFFTRTAIRKDMEQFSRFSSALSAICTKCFEHMSKIQMYKQGLYRLSLIGTRYFFSGMERDPKAIQWVKEAGGSFVLFNYKSLLDSSTDWISALKENDLYCLIDSGSFSIFNENRLKGKKQFNQEELFEEDTLNDMTLEGYAKFINQHKHLKRIIGFYPLDVVGDPIATKHNYLKLKSLTDAYIIPVWQFTDSLSELEKLVKEEHGVIAIGGMVPFLSSRKHIIRKVLDKVFLQFPTQCFHALGVADELLLEYKFFSADSTAFLNARKYQEGRKLYVSTGERVPAPIEMKTEDIIKQNIKFLRELENVSNRNEQLAFDMFNQKGA